MKAPGDGGQGAGGVGPADKLGRETGRAGGQVARQWWSTGSGFSGAGTKWVGGERVGAGGAEVTEDGERRGGQVD